MQSDEQQKKLRIGVLLADGRCEAKKEELVSITKRLKPWAKEAPLGYRINRGALRAKHPNRVPPITGIPYDVSIGQYIRYTYGENIEVDLIQPKDITSKRLQANDINFLIIYDILEAFHTDKTGAIFKMLRSVLNRANNVFPNLSFQELIYSKLKYYNYLKVHGLPIASTITISKQQWDRRVARVSGSKAKGAIVVAGEILEDIRNQGLERFICKPVYGQEGKGCKKYTTKRVNTKRFAGYLAKLLDKYPGMVIQDMIKDFGKTRGSPELRMYFVGREYQYTAISDKYSTCLLDHDGGNPRHKWTLPAKIDFDACKRLAVKVMDVLPTITLQRDGGNIPLPYLLTRVDIGCMRDGGFNPWINEVEFVPSLYIEEHTKPIESRMGDQMVKISKRYVSAVPRPVAKEPKGEEPSPLAVNFLNRGSKPLGGCISKGARESRQPKVGTKRRAMTLGGGVI